MTSQQMLVLVLGAVLILLFAGIVIVAMMLWLRHGKKRIGMTVEDELGERRVVASEEAIGFSVAAYSGVIQRLKEQEAELQRLRLAERGRAATSESVSEAVLSNLSSGVLLFSNTGVVRQANPAAKSILGYGALYGMAARDIFRGVSAVRREGGAEEPAAALLEAVEQCIRHGLPFRRIEADYATPAGERRVLGITVSPVRGGNGEPLGAACLVSDLTEISELSRQVRMREKMSALGEMSAGIAHEFKNSLATIAGYAQMLGREESPATVQQFAGRIASETANLTRIVTDFLNFARPQEMQSEEVAVLPLVEECVAECGVAADLSGIPEELAVVGDRTALRQAFANLLRNSAEAAAAAGRSVRVTVTAESAGGGTRLAFRDDGPGIPAEHLPNIFVPFFTTKAQGTGLGLALVHRIVTDHGGAVTVASSASGTVFTLSFPARKRAQTAVEAD